MAVKSAYTDGCCKGNPGIGGWGFAIFNGDNHNDKPCEFSQWGGEMATTNNRMELTAIIEAMQWLAAKKDAVITHAHIFTDSTYCKNGCTTWMSNWKKNDWKKADGAQVLNRDLWQTLDTLMENWNKDGRVLHFHWVKGHADDAGNNLADKLSNKFVEANKPPSTQKKKGEKRPASPDMDVGSHVTE